MVWLIIITSQSWMIVYHPKTKDHQWWSNPLWCWTLLLGQGGHVGMSQKHEEYEKAQLLVGRYIQYIINFGLYCAYAKWNRVWQACNDKPKTWSITYIHISIFSMKIVCFSKLHGLMIFR